MLTFFQRQRQVLFTYWDGSKKRRIDPVKAHKELWRIDGFDPAVDPIAAEGFEPDGETPLFGDVLAKAEANLAKAIEDGESEDAVQVLRDKLQKGRDGARERQNKAEAVTLGAVQQVFGVREYDEATKKGLTIWQHFELLGSFYQYIADLKKKRND